MKNMSPDKSTAICILGMHRSGTSSITRAINLLGVYLGEDVKLGSPGPDNLKGFWEHLEIRDVQTRLLARLNRKWDTVVPLPDGWLQSEAVRPFKDELSSLVAANFSTHPLWGWKEPQSCLLVPLWRDILKPMQTNLSCVFVVRNPADVAGSLIARNSLPFNVALGIWFHYNIVALKDAAGLPIVFLSYEQLLAAWEPELRRCATVLGLKWPDDEARLRKTMNAFIDPTLQHNQSPRNRLQELPAPVQELYQTLCIACGRTGPRHDDLDETVSRLSEEFRAYASFFETRPQVPRPGGLNRTWSRWQRSIRKRLPKSAAPSLL
jgi:hypothetical protein